MYRVRIKVCCIKTLIITYSVFNSCTKHLIRDMCLLLVEFVVVSQLTIFLLELLGSAEKPMAGPSSSKGKIVRWNTFQISGGKHNCLLLPVMYYCINLASTCQLCILFLYNVENMNFLLAPSIQYYIMPCLINSENHSEIS